MKPGIKTTEFWLSLVAVLLGAVMASGLIDPTHWVAQVVGAAVAVLASLGYSRDRRIVKTEGAVSEFREVRPTRPGKPVKTSPAKPPREGLDAWDSRGAVEVDYMWTVFALLGLIMMLAYGGCAGGWKQNMARGLNVAQGLGEEAALLAGTACGDPDDIIDDCVARDDKTCLKFRRCRTAHRAVRAHFVAVLVAKRAAKRAEGKVEVEGVFNDVLETSGHVCKAVLDWIENDTVAKACKALKGFAI